ncbi:adenylate kinase isoenzyme 6-like protein [Radiomyces spectabilis]|uniref:adenylate kinase isoenzyme 6-like protein n=1 Tax=Radiomyces spectabilis TaxID=64574 RepID=UPI00221F3ABE|nr:adenylate kinase isoenzyme 6-like protein [Radiomyces spectabilis]KAI8379461.1 adenylate kinase isoenzyme 6-like protein [Radiomyces spectabilis]
MAYASDSDSDVIPTMERDLPNILVTGTPGTGKTTTSEMIAQLTGLQHVNVGEIVKTNQLHEGYLEEFDTHVLDEDKLLDELEDVMKEGGKVVDFHTCEIFPERWFDLILVLRTDTATLYDRMEKRGYNKRKIEENMECEIMQVVLEAARESYAEEIVVELQSTTTDDMESNVERVKQWLDAWKVQHSKN